MRLIFHSGPQPADARTDLIADEVAALYEWPQRTSWVRAMMVTTLDGASAGPDGLSGSISAPADRLVFNAVRRFADAVVVGSGTLRSEEYSPMRAKAADQPARTAAGQRTAPTLVIVSNSLQLPWHLPMWQESSHQPIVITANSDPATQAAARPYCELVVIPEVTPAAIVAELSSRGLGRIICEGGPQLLNEFVATATIDELNITISPTMAGTGTSPQTPSLDPVRSYRLVSVLSQDDFLMARYLKPSP